MTDTEILIVVSIDWFLKNFGAPIALCLSIFLYCKFIEYILGGGNEK